MAASESGETKVNDLPAWITSKATDVFQSTRELDDEEEVSIWEVDRIKYQEARGDLRHFSYAFYIVLSFFAGITGWFLSLPGGRPFLALVVGSVFLLLQYIIAKTSRIAEDNLAIVKKLERAYKSKAKFKSSGIEGAGGFFSYIILSCATAYFLLYPHVYRLSYHRMRTLGPFLLLSAVLFVVSYYLLGDGKLGKHSLGRYPLGHKFLGFMTRKAKMLQASCYAATFILLLIYWYATWF
jgi:hypothetical protein